MERTLRYSPKGFLGCSICNGFGLERSALLHFHALFYFLLNSQELLFRGALLLFLPILRGLFVLENEGGSFDHPVKIGYPSLLQVFNRLIFRNNSGEKIPHHLIIGLLIELKRHTVLHVIHEFLGCRVVEVRRGCRLFQEGQIEGVDALALFCEIEPWQVLRVQ